MGRFTIKPPVFVVKRPGKRRFLAVLQEKPYFILGVSANLCGKVGGACGKVGGAFGVFSHTGHAFHTPLPTPDISLMFPSGQLYRMRSSSPRSNPERANKQRTSWKNR